MSSIGYKYRAAAGIRRLAYGPAALCVRQVWGGVLVSANSIAPRLLHRNRMRRNLRRICCVLVRGCLLSTLLLLFSPTLRRSEA